MSLETADGNGRRGVRSRGADVGPGARQAKPTSAYRRITRASTVARAICNAPRGDGQLDETPERHRQIVLRNDSQGHQHRGRADRGPGRCRRYAHGDQFRASTRVPVPGADSISNTSIKRSTPGSPPPAPLMVLKPSGLAASPSSIPGADLSDHAPAYPARGQPMPSLAVVYSGCNYVPE